jgi:glycosyltransferase involved in cell wall biosynthesis
LINDFEPVNGKTYVSLVIPCFNEEASIPLFYYESQKIFSTVTIKKEYEYVFVDDGSKDKTVEILRQLAAKDNRVHYISFSRNFGKEAAMLAGLQSTRGEFVAILDADLQHPPALIPKMLEIVQSGNADCVAAKRTRSGDAPFNSLCAALFYRIISKLTGMEITDGIGDFRLMSRQYVNAILSLNERVRFSKGFFPWVGFKVECVEYENVQRIAGNTKWPFRKLLAYSIDGITAFSSKLLHVASILGVLFFSLSFLLFILLVIRKLAWGVQVDGWTTIVCLIVFFGGIILLTIGIIGEYLGKIYTEVKQRPHYIIREAK